jgi:type II secretory pathway pseudopilin PulG
MYLKRPTVGARRSARAGFTLIELLVVISVIIVLVGILTAAVVNVLGRADDLEIVADIKKLETGVSAFKSDVGIEPPSKLVLFEQASDWNTANATVVRSKGLIRRMWPRFDFTQDRDIDGDGNMTETHTLEGSECLVFFLGGVPNPGDLRPVGFSKNPADPFSQPSSRDSPRQGPYTELDAGRLTDVDSDGFPEYKDPLEGQFSPYVYLSSYGGRGYDISDLPTSYGMTSAYMQSADSAWKKDSFQIISPGADGQYGTGGEYVPDTATSVLTGPRRVEQDNVTNFTSGTLVP